MIGKEKYYPFPCVLVGKGITINVNVIKISQMSVLADTGPQPLLVNDAFSMKFVVPLVKNGHVESEGVVFKTYDHFKGKHGEVQPGHHVAELVFKNLPDQARRQIITFIANTSVPETY
jgi:hypothetical protein